MSCTTTGPDSPSWPPVEASVNDEIWRMAVVLLARHDARVGGLCTRCRCATPCPGQLLARAGPHTALGVPSADAAYWSGLARIRAAHRHDPLRLVGAT